MNYIERDEFQLGYAVEGQGMPVIIIGSVIYYQRVFSQNLRQHCQLVFLDHRGFSHGPQMDVTKLTIDLLVEDIEYMRAQLGLEKFFVVGHSGHAYLALAYAKKYPNRVMKVVMIAVGPDQSQQSHDQADRYFQNTVCPERKAILDQNLMQLSDDLQKNSEQRFITFCLRLGAKSWYDMYFDASFLWRDVYVNMPIIDRIWGKLFVEVDVTDDLEAFHVPVVVMLGVFDYLVAPFYAWYSLLKKFHDIKILLFDRSSHCPQFEQQELFDEQFLQFLRK